MKIRYTIWLLVSCGTLGFAAGTKRSPEEAMGGSENLRAVLQAEIVSVEKVTVPPHIEVLGLENGHVKTNEVGVINWSWGMRLTIDKGPIAVPVSEAKLIKDLLRSPDIVPEFACGCGYLPCYRIELKEEGHTLEVYIMQITYAFETYRDGVRVGGHAGDMRLLDDFDALLESASNAAKTKP